MAAGGGGGRSWIYMLAGGGPIAGIGIVLEIFHIGPIWLAATLLAAGGLATVFGACEAMIKSVEAVGVLLGWSDFVAGAMAGLASNLPELVMLGFIIASEPRIAFVLVALTLHIGALAFGFYSALLPRGPSGRARLPEVLVKLSTDMYACSALILFAIGSLMLLMQIFDAPGGAPAGLDAADLYLVGGGLLVVQGVFVSRMVARFGGEGSGSSSDAEGASSTAGDSGREDGGASEGSAASSGDAPEATVGSVALYGIIGVGASFLGGHAVGDFAEILVAGLESYGYSQMIGALILAFFACAGVLAMIVTAHLKGLKDLALANVSGAVTQVPFVVLPVVMLMHAAFAQLGIVEYTAGGAVLPIDIQTTGVMLLGFPPMAILWKSISDDGTVNWVESVSMTVIFVVILFVLGAHG